MSRIASLYVISEGPDGPIKIGRSKHPPARLMDLQVGNARPLRLAAAIAMEASEVVLAESFLHEELEFHRMCGEWFNLSEEFMRGYLPDFLLANGFEVAA